MSSFGAVLDTCVLYPSLLRDILLTVAEAAFYKPYWSPDILDELKRNLIKDDKDPDKIEKLIAQMNRAFPAALVEKLKYQGIIDSMTNDPKDRHVLAVAVVSKSEILVTSNLKDFPQTSADPYSIEIQSPDVFLLNQFDLNPKKIVTVIKNRVSSLRNPPRTFVEIANKLLITAPQFSQKLSNYSK